MDPLTALYLRKSEKTIPADTVQQDARRLRDIHREILTAMQDWYQKDKLAALLKTVDEVQARVGASGE